MSQSSFLARTCPILRQPRPRAKPYADPDAPDQLQKEEYFSAQLAHVTLAPFAKRFARDAGEGSRCRQQSHRASARTEKLVEILHGFGERYRGTLFDAVPVRTARV